MTEMTINPFREWLNRKGMTVEDFIRTVPGVSYGFATKQASKDPQYRPKSVHETMRQAIGKVYPDCPLARLSPPVTKK